jgi:menaquinone-dependent protoporphyrinogen oxidase
VAANPVAAQAEKGQEMARFLIVYGSDEGQTAKVATYMATWLKQDRHEVDLMHGKKAPAHLNVAGYDGILIGASIHVGRYQPYMVDFVRRYGEEMAETLSAFFTVCLTARGDSADEKAQVAAYLENFMQTTDWYPDQAAAFAGALRYTKYGLVKRFIMKRINAEGGDIDTSRDYEYTDWASVDDFVESFAHAVVGDPVLANQ